MQHLFKWGKGGAMLLMICLLLIAMQTTFAQQQKSLIRGLIENEKGESLHDVSVEMRNETIKRSTRTNASGVFSFEKPQVAGKYEFIISHVGYEEQTITREIKSAEQKEAIHVVLQLANLSLENVVVTALNIKRNPRSLGSSIVKIDGNKVNTVQTPNLISALSGKVPGVDVTNTANGVAGSKRIIIRGTSSLTGNNQPLWVVDGIPINSSGLGNGDAFGGIDYGDGLTGINPDDIESITVLKGNASAALYGSRASNGVILVTTKTGGSLKGKNNIEVSSSLMADKLIDATDFQNQYGQSSRININQKPVNKDDAFGSENWGPKLDGVPTIQFDGVERPYSANNDNYLDFFKTGSTITNTMALSGTSGKHAYRVSFSDLRNKDIIPNAGFTRSNLNAKLTSTFGKLESDIVFNYGFEKAKNRPYTGGNVSNLFYSLMYLPVNISIHTLDPGYTPTGSEFTYADFISNPYFIVNKERENDTKNRLNGSVSLKYHFTKWLYARGRVTRDYYLSQRFRLIPDGVLYTGYLDGELDQRSRESIENNFEFILGTEPLDAGRIGVNAFVGGNINYRKLNQQVTSGNTFVVPGVYTFNNLQNKLPSTSVVQQRTNSLFASIEASFDKYLFLTLTGRNDWFSTLPVSNNNLFYPAAAISFIASDAIRLPAAISFAKLRASAAQVSGDAEPGQLDLSYALESVQYGTTNLQVISTSNIPNKYLKPLLSTDYEFGVEMDFMQSKFGFDWVWYNRSTKNDIVRTAVSSSTGYSTAVLNVGQLRNRGMEITLRATPLSTQNITWNINATFSHNTSKVMALGDGVQGAPILLANSKSNQASIKLEEGMPYGGIYGFTYKRDDSGNKIYDARGLPVFNSTQSLLANGMYDKLMGLSNTIRYKDISLYFLLDGKFGAYMYSETNAQAVSNGKHKMTLEGRETGITGPGMDLDGKQNTVMVPAEKINEYYKAISSIAEEFMYDASFVKLREVALSWNLPTAFLNRVNIRNAAVSLIGRNLVTLYKQTENVDPESSVNSSNAQGLERFVYPVTRNMGFTIKIGL